MTGFSWNDTDGRAEITFEKEGVKYTPGIRLWEPNTEYENNSIEKQQAKQAVFLRDIVSRFVPIEELKKKVKQAKSLQDFVEQLAAALPEDFANRELEVILKYGNRGYLEIPRSLGWLDNGVLRVKDSDQPKLTMASDFVTRFGTKPELPQSTVPEQTESKWGV
jgi:hypothetical protein